MSSDAPSWAHHLTTAAVFVGYIVMAGVAVIATLFAARLVWIYRPFRLHLIPRPTAYVQVRRAKQPIWGMYGVSSTSRVWRTDGQWFLGLMIVGPNEPNDIDPSGTILTRKAGVKRETARPSKIEHPND